ncbi:MAG: biotin/lipoate A/B protein ligase family protein [Gemmatimonadaceae bacterium]
MARDTALLARAARTGETVFSVYGWERPTLSLGRNQPANGRYDLNRIRAADVDIVRRPTGGRAILHHREATYSVTAPLEPKDSLRETYGRINHILVSGLARLGIRASFAAPKLRASAPSTRPCFETPAEGELVADGRKLVGSAQWRDEDALLQHGSILIENDQGSLAGFAANADEIERDSLPNPATLTDLMGYAPALEEIATAMFGAVRELVDPAAAEMPEQEIRDLALAEVPHFLDDNWTWRR